MSLGPVAGAAPGGQPLEYSLELGPSLFYQAFGMPDPREGGKKDSIDPGSIPANFVNPAPIAINAIPAAPGVTVATGTAATGVSLPLTTVFAPGVAPAANVRAGGVLNNAVALDMGWDVVGVVANNPTVTLTNGQPWRYYPGQWLALGGAGPAGATLFTQVTAVGSTSITVSPAPSTAATAAPVGGTNIRNPNAYGYPAATSYSPRLAGGIGAFLDAQQSIARNVVVTGGSGNVVIGGWDVYAKPQSETIATGAAGKKAFKWIGSAVPNFTGGTAVTVATGSVIGLPFAARREDLLEIWLAGAVVAPVIGTNQVVADDTTPAASTTGDPRGTITPGTLNGTSRLVVRQTLSLVDTVRSNQFNQQALYGVMPA